MKIKQTEKRTQTTETQTLAIIKKSFNPPESPSFKKFLEKEIKILSKKDK